MTAPIWLYISTVIFTVVAATDLRAVSICESFLEIFKPLEIESRLII